MLTVHPEICIVFNGGAMGDFLLTLLTQQIETAVDAIDVNSRGAVANSPAAEFKFACTEFYNSKFDPTVFEKCDDFRIVNCHHYFPELGSLFPKCKFYYIDDSNHQEIVINAFIKKRILPKYGSIPKWLFDYHSFPQISKFQNLTNEQSLKIIKRDWARNTKSWRELGLSKIEVSDISSKEKCRTLIKSMLQSNINEILFSNTFDAWAINNQEIIHAMEK